MAKKAAVVDEFAGEDEEDELSQEEAEEAIAALEAASSNVNLDELVTSEVIVAIREYATFEEDDDEGNPITRRKSRVRKARIEVATPMGVYNRMLDSRAKLLKRLKREEATKDEFNAAMAEWMIGPVFDVWRLSEPKMTVERLQEGLEPEQIQALFSLFFLKKARQKLSKA